MLFCLVRVSDCQLDANEPESLDGLELLDELVIETPSELTIESSDSQRKLSNNRLL